MQPECLALPLAARGQLFVIARGLALNMTVSAKNINNQLSICFVEKIISHFDRSPPLADEVEKSIQKDFSTRLRLARNDFGINSFLRAAHGVSAVVAFIAGAVADGYRAANVTGWSIIAEMRKLGVKLLQNRNFRLQNLRCLSNS